MFLNQCAVVSWLTVGLSVAGPTRECPDGARCHQEKFIGERCPLVAVAPDTGRFYLVYQDGHRNVLTKHSDDGGNTWSLPVTIQSSTYAGEPTMTVDGAGGVYVVWYESMPIEAYASEVWWSYSMDHGETWAPPGMVSVPGVFSLIAAVAAYRSPSDAITVKVLYAAQLEYPLPGKTVQYRWTDNLGASWSDAVTIDFTPSPRHKIKLSPDPRDSRAYIAYRGPGADAFYIAETDVPGVFTKPVNVTQSELDFTTQDIGLVLPKRRMRYMVWPARNHDGEQRFRMSYSDDEGVTWSLPTDIRSGEDSFRFPELIGHRSGTEADTLYTVAIWHPGHRVAFMKSVDSGQTWTEPADVCPEQSERCANALITHGGGHRLVVTMMGSPPDRTDVSHIYSRVSPDGGATWDDAQQITGLGSLIPYDANGDDDVDMADHAAFQVCYTGPCADTPCDPPLYDSLVPPVGNCQSMDGEDDGDVDVYDMEIFERLFYGPDRFEP